MLTTAIVISSMLAGSAWVCEHETRYMEHNLVESITAQTRYDDDMRFHSASETVYRRMYTPQDSPYPRGDLAAMAVIVEGQARLHDDNRLEFRASRAQASPLFDRIGMLSPEMMRETEKLYMDRQRRQDWPTLAFGGDDGKRMSYGEDGPTIECKRITDDQAEPENQAESR